MGLHDLPGDRREATDARIKNFLKLGFPAITRVRTGDRTDYTAEHVIQLLIGFELLRFRMPPSVIAAVVASDWTNISKSFAKAARALLDPLSDTVPDAGRELLSIDSLALHETGKTITPEDLKSSVEVEKAAALAKVIGSPRGGFRSGLIIDPTYMLDGIGKELPKLRRPMENAVFLKAIAAWR